jgi:RimJ/RimL family protein N-acetyltransferase
MILITSAAYQTVLPLFAEMDDHLPVVAALRGDIAADIYADDPVHPKVALVDVRHRRLYLAGTSARGTAELCGRLLVDVIYPAARAEGVPVLQLCYAPGGWGDYIDRLLPGLAPIRTARQYYEYVAGRPLAPARLPEGYALHRADALLLAADHLANLDALREEMTSERASVGDFLARSFGVCPVTDEALAGWCLSEYNTGDRCEVGIATLPPHQGKGLATATGAAFVEHALARSINRIGWHCFTDNRPSTATALKIGFRKVEDYPAYVVWCRQEVIP